MVSSEARKPYSPSNATEGEMFMASMCKGCTQNTDEGCIIVLYMMAGEQREEWIIGEDGRPTCTAFRHPEDFVAVPRCPSTLDMFEATE